MTTEKREALLVRASLLAVVALAACVALSPGVASARYMRDGAVQNGTTGGWNKPTDFVCIVGLHADGTLDIADGVTDRHTCQYLTKGTMNGGTPFDLSSMTSQDSCTKTGFVGPPANDGAKHAWATSICVDATGAGLSLKDLDRTQQMCLAIGGSWVTTGKCTAYNAQFKGQDADGTPLAFGSKGTDSSIVTTAGFCYASMDWSSVAGYDAANCPSLKATTAPFDADAAYDWSVSGTQCRYAKSIAGSLASALTKSNGTTYAAGTYIDLSAYTTMGDCLANGGSWNNWAGKAATIATAAGTGGTYKRPVWDYQAQAPDADDGCLHCHSSTVQYNGPAERWKDSYLETGHKNMLRKVTVNKNWAGPDSNGVLQIYTAYAAGALDFTGPTATVGGVAKPLLYIFGDWMAPAPDGLDVIVDMGGATGAKYNGTSNYSCAPCHTTGWSSNDGTSGLCSLSSKTTQAACTTAGGTWYPTIGVKGIGNSTYQPQEPAASFPGIPFTGAGKWDLDGIMCSRCHNAAVGPVTAAAIAASQFPTTYPTSGGMGNIPSGPEAGGTYATFLCYGCHQSIAKTNKGVGADNDLAHPEALPVKNSITTGSCSNPAKTSESACQAAGAIWTPTAYAPMFNGHVLGGSFLNSVHAEATGAIVANSLGKYDLNTISNSLCTGPGTPSACCSGAGTGTCPLAFGSSFKGYTCWQSSSSSSPALTWIDNSQTTQAGCEALEGQWSSGSCIREIKDKTTCEGLYGAGAWRAASQGSCVTCHDVHNSLFVAEEEEKALRKTCQNCHVDNASTGATASTAPQIVVAGINHLTGPGTPFDKNVGESPCVVCHMPKPTSGDFPMHVWRINTDVNYSTFPSAAEYGAGTVPTKKIANTAPDGAYTNAVWVDLDRACGQCHGGGTVEDAQHQSKVSLCTGAGVPDACCTGPGTGSCAKYRTKVQLAPVAQTMHDGGAVSYPTTFSATPSGLTVAVSASVTCSGTCMLDYVWDCGAGGTLGPSPGATASCTYATAGTKSITLTVMENGGNVGTATRGITLYVPAPTPVPGGLGAGCPNTSGSPIADTLSFDTNTWTASFTDSSTPSGAQVIVDWGDGSRDFNTTGASFSHSYRAAGPYLIVQKVITSTLQMATAPACTLATASFTIDGHIYKADGATPLGAATVSARSATTGNTIKTVYTKADGSFTIGSLKPDTYWLVVSKRGYTFPDPGTAAVLPNPGNPTIGVGPNKTGVSIWANP
jgi:hypothetical protein